MIHLPRAELLLSLSLVLTGSSFAASISNGTVVEDFTTLEYADLTSSNLVTAGVWDTSHQQARSHVYANGILESSRPVDFGDGSDGVVNSATGYTFNTNTHQDGFNFQSLNISAGAITVTGSYPLIIRSLSTINIDVALNVSGTNGDPGNVNGLTNTGKVAKTCSANGGDGGAANATAGSDGGDAIMSDGNPEGGGNYGQGQTTVNSNMIDGQGAISGPASNDFETNTNFVCGGSGPGGGGFSDGASLFASGGAGGAGGGIVKLVAIGDITLTAATEAKGGDGGNGITVAAGPLCSGNGSGGNGGVIWMQSLSGITTTLPPDVSGGNSGTSACYIGSGASFFSGFTRGDTRSTDPRPGWAGGSYDTEIVPANLQSTIQSKSYPLGVMNASFSTPTVTSTGTVSVTYAGSKDGTTFSGFVSDITTLSNQGYRYVKWRAVFTNPVAAGASPTLSQVSIPFTDLGISAFDIKLSAGCASLQAVDSTQSKKHSDWNGFLNLSFQILILFGISRLFRNHLFPLNGRFVEFLEQRIRF